MWSLYRLQLPGEGFVQEGLLELVAVGELLGVDGLQLVDFIAEGV